MTRESVLQRTARGFAGLGNWISRTPVRWKLALRDLQDARSARFESLRAPVPSLRARQEELIQFYDQFENLVETLCDAAQYGPDAKLEGRFAEQKSWMQAQYPGLRRFVAAYLRYDPCDAARSQDLHSEGRDAFEALFAAPTLEAFLRSDDGNMIARIERAREALSRYGEHLRQLIAQDRKA